MLLLCHTTLFRSANTDGVQLLLNVLIEVLIACANWAAFDVEVCECDA